MELVNQILLPDKIYDPTIPGMIKTSLVDPDRLELVKGRTGWMWVCTARKQAVDPAGHIERAGVADNVKLTLEDVNTGHKKIITAKNLVTQVGDQLIGERYAGIASPPDQVTGMKLGTGTTAAAKTGAGAALVTYLSGSNQAFEGSFPTSALQGSSRRIQYRCIWVAGDATNSAITEAVIVNETISSDTTSTASETMARVVFTAIDKTASTQLTIDWNIDILGA